jgi:hypothetical protein
MRVPRTRVSSKIHESQRSKANSTIKGIGRGNDIEDLIKVCANLCAIQCAIVNVKGGGFPFLHKFGVKIILCIHNPAFQRWYSNKNSKLLHLHFIFMQKTSPRFHTTHKVFLKLQKYQLGQDWTVHL